MWPKPISWEETSIHVIKSECQNALPRQLCICWWEIWSWTVTVKRGTFSSLLFFWMKVQQRIWVFPKTFKELGYILPGWLGGGGRCLGVLWGSPQGLNQTTKAKEKGSAPLECVLLPHYWYIHTRLRGNMIYTAQIVTDEYLQGRLWAGKRQQSKNNMSRLGIICSIMLL